MRYILITTIYLAMSLNFHAQPNAVQLEYFLDADSGVGLNTVLDITTPDINITDVILADIPNTTPTGYHKLFIRVKDANGMWSQTIRKSINIAAPYIENKIVMGEYYLDNDPEFGNASTFAISPEEDDIEHAFTAQIQETASLGYHKLFGRVQDSKGNWSHTFRKIIKVYENPVSNLVEIEYFFGDDLEFGNNTPVSIDVPIEAGTWTFDVPYPEGTYSFDDALYIRIKDSNENWSITTVLDEIGTLGVKENIVESVIIYPNPFQDKIEIASTNSLAIETISVYNTLGKLVYQSHSNLTNLNLGFLSQGIYYMKLSSKQGNASFKIVKK
jgi:hypothetical protein